jgi:hypothetical protein
MEREREEWTEEESAISRASRSDAGPGRGTVDDPINERF